MINREDMIKAIDMKDYYRIPADQRGLNYEKYFTDGQYDMSSVEEYHSHSTHRLNVEQTKELLLKLELIIDDIKSVG